MNRIFYIWALLWLFSGCRDKGTQRVEPEGAGKPVRIEASPQRSGDPEKGFAYLVSGNYVSSGVPLSVYANLGIRGANELNRSGEAADIPYSYNLTTHANGVKVVTPNCLQCHAQVFDGRLVIGLGRTDFDLTTVKAFGTGLPDQNSLDLLAAYISQSPRDQEAFLPFYRAVTATNRYLVTNVVGANSASKLAGVLAAHRDPVTLQWLEQPLLKLDETVYPADVPAWWLLKKKHAMFHAGWGRGDFSRIMMAAGVLTMKDSSEARQIDSHFQDVYAFIRSLEPPRYTRPVDQVLAEKGRVVFRKTCSGCHGIYEKEEASYPNYLVPVDVVKTDAYMTKDDYHLQEFTKWYNNSWFAKGAHAARIENANGYVAPPLDGVWATAPYLHNGSVPTLYELLNSAKRPRYWRKELAGNRIDTEAYDYENVGWKYTAEKGKTDKFTYDTTKPGYGNQGHTFGDKLSGEERKSVIEYLKTL